MARRLVAYDDLAGVATASSPALAAAAFASTSSPKTLTANGKQAHWTSDGQPISASASRKYNKTLQMLARGEIAAAEAALRAEGMEAAKEGVEMRQALAWAKKKQQQQRESGDEDDDDDDGNAQASVVQSGVGQNGKGNRAGPGETVAASQDDEDEEDSEDAVDDEGGFEDALGDDMDMTEGVYNDTEQDGLVEWQPGTTIHWQGLTSSSAPRGRNAKRQKQLTHAEIWDDSALVDAWDAAMEEYKLFDAQRTAHQKQQKEQQNGQASEENVGGGARPTKQRHSALWHDLPAVASNPAALTSSTKDELERRKRQAKALLAQCPSTEESGEGAKDGSTDDSAWLAARDVVAQTPNQVGGGAVKGKSTASHEASDGGDVAVAEGTLSKEEVLQNLAMAWYYAGYYQALASQM